MKSKKWSVKKKLLLGSAAALVLISIFAVKQGGSENLEGKFIGLPANKAEVIKMLVADSGVATVSSTTKCAFPDITGTEWYADFFYTACENDWITVPTENADPSGYYNKAEVSKIAYNVYGVSAYTPASPSYTDVAEDSWYYKYIESLNHAGAYGKTSGTFKPDETPSRSFMLYLTAHL